MMHKAKRSARTVARRKGTRHGATTTGATRSTRGSSTPSGASGSAAPAEAAASPLIDSGEPIHGYNERRTSAGICVVEIDYFADPSKDEKWAAQQQKLYPNQTKWRREFCVRASTRILTEDLRWVPASSLVKGDSLIGFDERLHHHLTFKRSAVRAITAVEYPSVKVVTDRGTITVSAAHEFVVRRRKFTRSASGRHMWVQAKDLTYEDQILFLGHPWEPESTWEAGWLAGMFDGEGHIHRGELGVSQNEGLLLNRLRQALSDRGMQYHEGRPNNGKCTTLRIHRIYESMRLLGQIRPQRLIGRAASLWEGRSVLPRTGGRYATVLQTHKSVAPESFLAIETSTKTLITDGYFSHNCRDWTSSEGTPFYPEFIDRMEEYIAPLSTLIGGPVLRGFDFGIRRPACCWLQFSREQDRAWVIREILPEGIDTYTFRDLILYLSGQRDMDYLKRRPRAVDIVQRIREGKPPYNNLPEYAREVPWFPPGLYFHDFAGHEAVMATANVENEHKDRTAAAILAAEGIRLQPYYTSHKAAETVIRRMLHFREDGHPGLLFDPACAILIRAFGGGLVFAPGTKENPVPDTVKKDGLHDHLHEALGYVLVNYAPINDPHAAVPVDQKPTRWPTPRPPQPTGEGFLCNELVRMPWEPV